MSKMILARFDSTTVFRAPFSGLITYLPFHQEDTVFAQQPVLRLEDPKNRYVEVSLEQRGALRIREGQPATLIFESLRNEKFEGKVRNIYSRMGDFVARIDVKSLPDAVLPGMTADVAIEVGRTDSALLIPISAVSSGRVVRERNGRREKIGVKLGSIDGNWGEVLEGDIKPDDKLLVRSAQDKGR